MPPTLNSLPQITVSPPFRRKSPLISTQPSSYFKSSPSFCIQFPFINTLLSLEPAPFQSIHNVPPLRIRFPFTINVQFWVLLASLPRAMPPLLIIKSPSIVRVFLVPSKTYTISSGKSTVKSPFIIQLLSISPLVSCHSVTTSASPSSSSVVDSSSVCVSCSVLVSSSAVVLSIADVSVSSSTSAEAFSVSSNVVSSSSDIFSVSSVLSMIDVLSGTDVFSVFSVSDSFSIFSVSFVSDVLSVFSAASVSDVLSISSADSVSSTLSIFSSCIFSSVLFSALCSSGYCASSIPFSDATAVIPFPEKASITTKKTLNNLFPIF